MNQPGKSKTAAFATGVFGFQPGFGAFAAGQAEAVRVHSGGQSQASGPNRRRVAEEFEFAQFRNPMAMNPYGGAAMGYGSAVAGYPYGPPATSYYGGPGPAGAMGGGANGGQGNDPGVRVGNAGEDKNTSTLQGQPARPEQSGSNILTAAGVPSVDGRMVWPVGLRSLGHPDAQELCRRIEALLALQMNPEASEAFSAQAAQELAAAVKSLRKLLQQDREERFSLPLRAYEDSEAFLAQLERAQQFLSAAEVSSSGPRAEKFSTPHMPEEK